MDSSDMIQSNPNPLDTDPDPVQSVSQGQNANQSSPIQAYLQIKIRLVSTIGKMRVVASTKYVLHCLEYHRDAEFSEQMLIRYTGQINVIIQSNPESNGDRNP